MTDIEKELRLASLTSPLVVLGKAENEIKRLREQNAALMAEGDRLRRHHAEFLEALAHLRDRDDEVVAKINKKATP